MCLITPWENSKTASEDIHVFKILSNQRVSPFYKFLYKKNKLYETGMVVFGPTLFINYKKVEDGFHAYKYIERAKEDYISYYKAPHFKCKIYKAIIPKGANYFEGNDDDIVSDRIIIKGEICV